MNREETKRLQELESYQILDAELHEELDGLTRIASTICNTPISLINLLDSDYQITKSNVGLDIDKISKESSFCQYTISGDELMVVEDALKDERFKDSPFVTQEPGIRFYAAMPLETPGGFNIGTICVIDKKPRQLTDQQKRSLKLLAEEVVARLELFKKNKQLEKADRFLSNSSDIQAIIDPDTLNILEISNEAFDIFDRDTKDFIGEKFGDQIADLRIKDKILDFIHDKEQPRGSFICPVTKKGGELVYLELTYSLYKNLWYMTARDITDRENNLEKLKETRVKKETILNSVSDCIIIFNQENEIIQFNYAAEKTFGYSKEEVLGQPLDKIMPEKHRDNYQHSIHQFLKSGSGAMIGQLIEMSALHKDGSEFPVELQVNHIENSAPPQFIWILRDISERRRTQRTLKKTLTNLNIGQELAEVGSWTWRIKEDTVRWSEKVYDILDIDNVNKKPSVRLFLDSIHPDDQPKVEQKFAAIQEGVALDIFEHRIITSSGQTQWVRHSAQVTYDASSNPVEVNGAIQNVTKQKQTQLRLEREKELSDKIINSLPIAFFMYDREGNAIRWNDKVREATGYNEQQIAYMNPSDFFSPKQHNRIDKEIKNIFVQGDVTVEGNLKDKSGTLIPYIFSATLFESSLNQYFLGTGIDVSEMKKYERQLEDSLKEKEVLLAEIHHRVKNNLAIISGLLQLESFNAQNPKTKNILQNSQLRIQSMAKTHEMLYNSESFNDLAFENFVPNIVESIKGVYQLDKNITFELDIDDIALNVNQAIPCGLVINELISNAYKHAFTNGDQGVIKTSLKKQGNTIELNVRDNGRGLPEQFSLQETSSMGFSLVKTLVQQLDATLELESQQGTDIAISFDKEARKGSSSSFSIS